MSLNWKLWLLMASKLSAPLEQANDYGSDHQWHFCVTSGQTGHFIRNYAFLSHNRVFFFANKLFLVRLQRYVSSQVSYCRRRVGFPSRNLQYQFKTPHGIPSFKDFSAPRLHREPMLNPAHSYRFNLPGRKGKERGGLGFLSTHNNQQSLSAMDQTLYCPFIRSLAHCYQLPLTLQLEIWHYGIWCSEGYVTNYSYNPLGPDPVRMPSQTLGVLHVARFCACVDEPV